ncbi:28S ribosomal protein S22, mitochondrial-like [Hydractinia symbiolongicarpus]|uniref:28S ribosomal protein S22, mitochondrial-like n=1 Tax=Hydractinia symbiolongicarpus TaxID=13093 RepID=UPI00254CCFCD|nr:28S ribosomal protein S22, mitochondrial-like [Hydractinia symbiolongicarpus]
MAARCMQCARANNNLATIIRRLVSPHHNISSKSFCSPAKVPPDVLMSKANDFSGKKSIIFENNEVQNILKRLTGLNLEKVFKTRKENLKNPVYKVLDEQELQQDEESVVKKAENLLKMPPVMARRKPIKVVLSEDPEIINHDEDGANIVFTDISPSKDSRTRAVLVRENDTGVLREGTWDERDRMQFIYWPKEGQHHEIVPMLQDEHLPLVFDQLRHEDILDFINIQCEPDAPDYIRVHERVYDDLEQRQMYHLLDSTRHYGGMVFYYVTRKKTNTLLGYYIRQNRISDGVDLIKLHLLVNADTSFKPDILQGEELLKAYLTHEGLHDLLTIMEADADDAVST